MFVRSIVTRSGTREECQLASIRQRWRLGKHLAAGETLRLSHRRWVAGGVLYVKGRAEASSGWIVAALV